MATRLETKPSKIPTEKIITMYLKALEIKYPIKLALGINISTFGETRYTIG